MSASKTKKDAQAGGPQDQQPLPGKDKMIRLDDLIPKQNVRGGRKLFFGATDTQQPNQKQKDN
ncbi:MAG: hypothetical protein M3Z22_07295 [Verrucomicrobiota bacterium]|nr:hypothetical protein [Verrucomicrobiota bacterium]